LRILVADDHPSVRRFVCGVLEAEEGWLVCGEATNGREAVEMAVHLKPDVVILDLSMPELNGLEAARQILKTIPQTDVVILTLHEGEDLRQAALESGASACMVKTDLPRLVMEVRTIVESNRGAGIHTPNPDEVRPEEEANRTETSEHVMANLTGREREIFRLLAVSKTTKEIAVALSIDLKTVELTRGQIMKKLGMESIVDFVRYARRMPKASLARQKPA
jgi:DNA-binding NarL/FixJ family response regulator